MSDILGHLRRELLDELQKLEFEADAIYTNLVVPGWDDPTSRLGGTLHAYMMALLSRLDLASAFWTGSEDDQSKRMCRFFRTFISDDVEVARVLIQLWRHKLMHTGKPRPLGRGDGLHYYWLLHWREHLPRAQHLTFSDGGRARNLNVGMFYLITDMHAGFSRFCDAVASTPRLAENAERMRKRLALYRFHETDCELAT